MSTKVSELPSESAPTATDYVVLLDTETNTLKKVLVSELLADNLLVGADGINGIKKANLTTDSNPYKFFAYLGTAQNSGTGGWFVVNYTNESFDTNDNFDTATNKGRYTAPVDGFYWFGGSITYLSSNATEIRIATIRVNGVERCRGTEMASPGTMNFTCHVSGFVQLTAGQYVEIYGYSLASRVLDTNVSWFSGYLVSRT